MMLKWMINSWLKAGRTESEKGAIRILYGTQTGNSKFVAGELCRYLKKKGFNAAMSSMDGVQLKQLHSIQYAFMVISTHGQGAPPEQAEDFFRGMRSLIPHSLGHLHYAICALGDEDYIHFCKAGRDLDQYLQIAGARAMFSLTTCDTDFREPATRWIGNVYAALSGKEIILADQPSAGVPRSIDWYQAEVVCRSSLYKGHPERLCWHLQLQTNSEILPLEPGDCIGVIPVNNEWQVKYLLSRIGWSGNEMVTLTGNEIRLKDALLYHLEITSLNIDLIHKYAGMGRVRGISLLMNHEPCLQEYARMGDVTDLITDFPQDITPEQLVRLLPPLVYRYYSVASGKMEHPGGVAIAVRPLFRNHKGRMRTGAASVPLGNLQSGDLLKFHIKNNPTFRLPEDEGASIIMVGTGTGIAPFRAFLQERKSNKSWGRNWLLAGDAYRKAGILYQSEMEKFQQQGVLQRLDLVFSRDGENIRYVQDLLDQNAVEILRWLQEGAYLYLCGSVKMAEGVRAVLLKIIMQYKKMNLIKAEKYLFGLKLDNRFCEDVY